MTDIVNMTPEERLANALDRIHEGMVCLPDGSDAIGRKVMRGRQNGTWVLEVPPHGSVEPGVQDTNGYFLSMVGSQPIIGVTARVNIPDAFDPDQFEEQTRVVAFRELPNRAAAGNLLKPLRLAMLPFRQATDEASISRDDDEWKSLTKDIHAR